MIDTCKGMFAIGNRGDRYAIYCENSKGLGFNELAPAYTFKEFISDLGINDLQDLQLSLLEIADKSGDLDLLIERNMDEITNYSFYFPDEPYVSSIDILGFAWFLDIPLLSLSSSSRWAIEVVKFAKYDPEDPVGCILEIYNVASQNHGLIIKRRLEDILRPTLKELLPNCQISNEFMEWLENLEGGNKSRVLDKLEFAAKKKFEGGEPLFKTLNNGIREVRFNATAGGAIRVLFARLSDKLWLITNAFIKKSDNEGYDKAIKDAEIILETHTEKTLVST